MVVRQGGFDDSHFTVVVTSREKKKKTPKMWAMPARFNNAESIKKLKKLKKSA